MSKNDPFEWTLLFCGIAILCFTVFVAIFDKYYSPKLTEQDYYNKFCTKNFDVSCKNTTVQSLQNETTITNCARNIVMLLAIILT